MAATSFSLYHFTKLERLRFSLRKFMRLKEALEHIVPPEIEGKDVVLVSI